MVVAMTAASFRAGTMAAMSADFVPEAAASVFSRSTCQKNPRPKKRYNHTASVSAASEMSIDDILRSYFKAKVMVTTLFGAATVFLPESALPVADSVASRIVASTAENCSAVSDLGEDAL